MAEPLIITDGNTRLIVDTDPGTHRLRVTMQGWFRGYHGNADSWDDLGCVSMDPATQARLADSINFRMIGNGHE